MMLHFTQFVIKSKWNICGISKLLYEDACFEACNKLKEAWSPCHKHKKKHGNHKHDDKLIVLNG
jgi:hypothetical protein